MSVAEQSLVANESTKPLDASKIYAGRITFQIKGTWVGTVTFYGTMDESTTDVAIQATNLATGAASTTTTGNGIFRIDASGLTQFFVKFTRTSGTVVVIMQPVIG